MFIIKFNNMVRNKWIWAGFAIVVAVAFGASDMLDSAGANASSQSAYGDLAGKPVDPVRVQILEKRARVFDRAADRRSIWRDYAALARAEELGVSASPQEVGEFVAAQFGGSFTPEAYREFLARADVTAAAFEEIVRIEIVLMRLRSVVAAPAMFAPASVAEDQAHGLVDEFTVVAAELENPFDPASVEVTDAELAQFHRSNGETFRVPERRQAVYVAFKADEFAAGVDLEEGGDTVEDLVLDYFNNHLDQYPDVDLSAGPNDVQKAAIVELLKQERAQVVAYERAAEFAESFADPASAPASFEAAAAALGRTVSTSGLAAATEVRVSQPSSEEFWKAVFDLPADGPAADRIREVADGAVSYVVLLADVRPSAVPALDDIRDQVAAALRASKAADSFRDRCAEIHDLLEKGIAEGISFRDVASSNGLAATTNMTFSFATATSVAGLPSARAVAAQMTRMDAGALAPNPPVETEKGALFFQVLDRTPASPDRVEGARGWVQNAMRQEAFGAVWEAWLDSNLAAMDPKPRTPFEADAPAAN